MRRRSVSLYYEKRQYEDFLSLRQRPMSLTPHWISWVTPIKCILRVCSSLGFIHKHFFIERNLLLNYCLWFFIIEQLIMNFIFTNKLMFTRTYILWVYDNDISKTFVRSWVYNNDPWHCWIPNIRVRYTDIYSQVVSFKNIQNFKNTRLQIKHADNVVTFK